MHLPMFAGDMCPPPHLKLTHRGLSHPHGEHLGFGGVAVEEAMTWDGAVKVGRGEGNGDGGGRLRLDLAN